MSNTSFFRIGDEDPAHHLSLVVDVESGSRNAWSERNDFTVVPESSVKWRGILGLN